MTDRTNITVKIITLSIQDIENGIGCVNLIKYNKVVCNICNQIYDIKVCNNSYAQKNMNFIVNIYKRLA